MRVKPSQLVLGCVLLDNVKGKTNRIIIPKKTVLTDEHIILLEKFLVDTVHVSTKLVKGDVFIPKESDQEVNGSSQLNNSFTDEYMSVITEFKRIVYGNIVLL